MSDRCRRLCPTRFVVLDLLAGRERTSSKTVGRLHPSTPIDKPGCERAWARVTLHSLRRLGFVESFIIDWPPESKERHGFCVRWRITPAGQAELERLRGGEMVAA